MAKYSKKILDTLMKFYPEIKCALNFESPWQLLVATVLSAQCTDERVNKVTVALFEKYPNVEDYIDIDLSELEKLIFSTGFYKNKARYIKAAAMKVVDSFQGKVPSTMEELITIPGVARKTANVVLSEAFNINEGIAVDTHVKRLSNKLGLTKHNDPKKIELDLMAEYDQRDWRNITHVLITHGRRYCFARKPNCKECPLGKICPSYKV